MLDKACHCGPPPPWNARIAKGWRHAFGPAKPTPWGSGICGQRFEILLKRGCSECWLNSMSAGGQRSSDTIKTDLIGVQQQRAGRLVLVADLTGLFFQGFGELVVGVRVSCTVDDII